MADKRKLSSLWVITDATLESDMSHLLLR